MRATISFTVYYFVCLSVCLCGESSKSTNFGSRYLVEGLSEGDEIWHLDGGSLAVPHHCD